MITGGCMCGAVCYTLTSEPLSAHACHCTDCQRSTGSAFVLIVVIDKADFEVHGEVQVAAIDTPSGAGYDAYSCRQCQTTLWCDYHFIARDILALRGGTLDDASAYPPRAHIFVKSKQPWLELADGLPVFEEFFELGELWPPATVARFEDIAAREGD